MITDLKHAVRRSLRNPILSAVIVLSVGVGIGANSTVLAWIRGSLFHPLPAVNAEVVALEARTRAGLYVDSSWLEYRDLCERLPSFSGVFAQRITELNLGEPRNGERVWAELVSGNFFSALGLRPALGRFYLPEETAQPGGGSVIVVSEKFWRTRYAGAEDAIGRTLMLNNHPFTIIGVAPRGFHGGLPNFAFDVWVPATMARELSSASNELTDRSVRNYVVEAVINPGTSRAQAIAQLASVSRALAAEYPETNAEIAYEVVPLWQSSWGGSLLTGALGTLQILTLLILIVVCVNSASLLLSRASTRRREIGIRLAIGARPGSIMRLLLAEGLLLAVTGSAVGILLSVWGVDAVRQIPLPAGLPVNLQIQFDLINALVTMGIGAGCGILFGMAPGLQLARTDLQDSLRGGRGAVGSKNRMQQLLVASEVAVAMLVLVLAGLFLKSYRHTYSLNPGYSASGVLLAEIDLAGRDYSPEAGRRFLRDLLARLREHPNVESVAAASSVPFSIDGLFRSPVQIEGTPPVPGSVDQALYYHVTPDYFATMGIPMLAGVDLAPLDGNARAPDAVINEEMARRYWPDVSPLGRHFTLNRVRYEVVGVGRNSKYETMAEPAKPLAWLTLRERTAFRPTLHIRVRSGDPEALLGDVRATVDRLNPQVPLLAPRSFARHFDQNMILSRVPAQLLAMLGPLGLALAAIGLYAVIAYSLAQREREIGVRLALGAKPQGVVLLMIWQGLRIVFAGAAIGLILSFLAGFLLENFLVGVPLGDPLIYGGVPALLLFTALLACWFPARRAAKVDPMIALRAE